GAQATSAGRDRASKQQGRAKARARMAGPPRALAPTPFHRSPRPSRAARPPCGTPAAAFAAAPPATRIGRVMKATWFGRYLLLDRVAAGGMAEVWRAKITGESGFQRIIAVKKILPHVSEDPDFIAMFTDEANITVQLQHPNIGQVYEFSKLDDIYFIAMEYISGKDVKTVWSHMRQRKTVIPPALSCYIVQKMAEGLAYAHNKRDNFGNPLGIVHRDISPQNVLLSWDGEVK